MLGQFREKVKKKLANTDRERGHVGVSGNLSCLSGGHY